MTIDLAHDAAATIIQPFFKALEGVLDETEGKVKRTAYGVFAALTLPLALVQIPIRRMACDCAPHPYSYFRGTGVEQPEARTLFQLNVCCPPIDSRTFGGVVPWRLRIDALAAHIRDSGADLVCLQEVYDRKAADALIARLGGEYAHIFYDIGPQSYGCNCSGLMVLSKAPLKNVDFRWYMYGLGAEAWGMKGAIAFDVAGMGHVINTHLQYSRRDDAPQVEEQAIRARQLAILRGLVPADRPTLVVGDLNIRCDTEEERRELEPYFYNLLTPQIREEGTCRYGALDYVMQSRIGAQRPYDVRKIPSGEITDHDGLVTTLMG